MPTSITEIKHNLGKPDQTFTCKLLYHGGRRLVISYRSTRDYILDDINILAGTLTQGYYEEGLPYIVWKMTGPDGALVGHYVHLCNRVIIKSDRVEYDDQLLDLWFPPKGACRMLDEEELIHACDNGLMELQTAQQIRTTAKGVLRRFSSIREDFDALLATLESA